MRSRTAGLAIAAIMAAATAGCAGASAIDGTTPAESDQEHLPRVADDSELGEDPSANSPSTQTPDRATTVVPTPSRPGRGNAAEDPYLPPRAVIPAPTGTPDAPPPSSTTPPTESPTTPSEPPESTTPAPPTMPTPERPKPLLPPNGDSGGSLWPFDEPEKPENAEDGENPEKPAKPAKPEKPEKPNKGTDTPQNGTNGESGENDAPTSPGSAAADDADEGTNDTGATTNGSDRANRED